MKNKSVKIFRYPSLDESNINFDVRFIDAYIMLDSLIYFHISSSKLNLRFGDNNYCEF